jgi:uncharacterized protein YjbJ (UPF0337 family)
MNRDELEGKTENLKGRFKETLGALTGDRNLQVDGATEQADGVAQERVGEAHRTLGEAIEKLGKKIKH